MPAGTPQANPQYTSIEIPPRLLTRIDWRVPPGPQGNMGFLISMGDIPVLPLPAGTYIIANDQAGTWLLDDQPDSGAWQVTAYNTGSYPHSVFLTLYCDLIDPAAELIPVFAPVTLTDSPDLSHRGPPVRGRP